MCVCVCASVCACMYVCLMLLLLPFFISITGYFRFLLGKPLEILGVKFLGLMPFLLLSQESKHGRGISEYRCIATAVYCVIVIVADICKFSGSRILPSCGCRYREKSRRKTAACEGFTSYRISLFL